MKEIVQLNLTEEESIILQSLVAVGITLRTENITEETLKDLEKRTCSMNLFMRTWPEASSSLADKMTELVEASKKIIETVRGGIIKK